MKPFIKWAGGKSQLLDQLGPLMPPHFGSYFEPFMGGAAVFFSLGAERRGEAHLNDLNYDLVCTYAVVRDRVEELVWRLKEMRREAVDLGMKESFYAARSRFNEIRLDGLLVPSEELNMTRASLFIFLNKTCFNGLWRENRKGGFNVPWNKKQHPRVCQEGLLRAASESLQGVRLTHGGFAEAVRVGKPKPGDLVYLDPPYIPVSNTASFTTYTKHGFGPSDQEELARVVDELAGQGVYVMVSNSDSDVVRELYSRHRIEEVDARRSINSKGGGRAKVKEFIVCAGFNRELIRARPATQLCFNY
jgi:DNA adenine methylase